MLGLRSWLASRLALLGGLILLLLRLAKLLTGLLGGLAALVELLGGLLSLVASSALSLRHLGVVLQSFTLLGKLRRLLRKIGLHRLQCFIDTAFGDCLELFRDLLLALGEIGELFGGCLC